MIHFSDRAIVEGLKLNSDYIIKHVYQEFFPTIRYLIKKNTGNDEDAEDIFQESLIVVLKNVQKEDFYLSCSFLTYLYSISKNLWMQKLKSIKKGGPHINIIEEFFNLPETSTPETAREEQLKYRIYREHFNTLGKD